MKQIILGIVILIVSINVNAEILKSDFMKLNTNEQNRMLQSSYSTANTLLALTGIGDLSTASGPREMFACMKDRGTPWLRKIYFEFQDKHPEMATKFSQNISFAIAWKCGLISFEKEL